MRKIGKIIFSFLFVCCTVIGFYITDQSFGMEASAAGNPPQAPERLKVNLLDKPLGVSKDGLRFSWSFEDPDANEYQSAYHIVVASSKAQFLQKEYVYDSGWSDASASSGVEPAGLPECLTDNGLYYWAVQVRDSQGLESELSQPEMLVTSVGDQWTNKNGIWGSSSQKFVFLRNKLSLDKPVEKVIASVTAASTETTQQYVYQFYVNGQLVGLGPSVKNLSDLYYNTYDITSLLNQGENILGAVCYAEDKQGFLCQITAFYEDGTKEVLCNSGSNPSSWQALDANEIYGYQGKSIASYYHASPENLNGTKFPYGWNQAEFQGTGWKSALSSGSIEEKNQGELTPYPSGNMTRYQQPAASVTRLSDGSYVVDLGKEIIGSIRLTVDSPKQQTVTLLYGEERNNDGTVKSKMRTGNVYEEQWVLKKGEQTLEGIGMKCFRYIQIKNFPASLTAEQITGLTIRQEFDDSQSSFSSSNQMLNEIYEMTKYTVKTAAQSQYVDSQSRERKTYEGDILVQMMSSFSFLDDYSLARHSLDYVVNNPTWPAEYQLFAITAAWQEYLYSGDIAFLRDHYDQLKNALYDSSYNSNLGLVHNPGKVVMVDWPYSQRDSYEVSNTAYNTAFNAVCSSAYRDMGNIAAALGYGDDASFLKERSDVIKQNMISRLYDQNTGRFYDGLTEAGAVVNHCAQHATAFSLACGIYADQAMADRMSATIVADGTIRMSVYGSYFLLDGLYQSGSGTLARQFMSNPDTQYSSNSWAYMLKKLGATMSTEAWSPEAKGNMTFSHAWGSSPASQIVRGMFGIKPTAPGFSQFEVKVQPGGLTEGAVEIPTVKGTIPVSFRLAQDGVITVRVSVPANTQAQVLLPANADGSRSVTVNGTDTQAEVQQNFVKVSLGSGTYKLVYDTGTAPDPSEITIPPVVNAEAYVGGLYFWQEPVTMDGVTCGTEGRGLPLNGLRFTLSGNGISGGISSSVNLIKNGWQGWKEAGELNGNAGNGQAVQAVRLKLTGEAAQQYDLYYRVHSKTYGWLDWAKNGQIAGTIGLDKQMEAIQIRIVKKDGGAPGSTTRPFVQKSQDVLTYQTHVQSYGWQNDVGQGKISGTVGQAKRLEAIQIELTGGLAEKYDVYYRVHSQTYGWLGWVKNGEPAGTEGLAKRLEGIQITLVEKGGSAPGMYGGGFIKPGLGTKDGVNYKTHIESYGWQSWRSNGESSGTMGEAKRLEGICIQVQNPGAAGDIEYQTHVQTYGWQNWVKNGAVSGTQGQAKRLEAIKIRLTGALAEKYDVYYRVHAQTYGWLDWAKNGEAAGTEGLAKRLEAIEIRLVEKGGSAPGSTERPYVTPPPATVDGINYQTHVQTYGWQAWKANGAVSGTSGEAKRLESIRILLQNPGYSGSVEYQTHVQTYGWQNWVKDGAESGTSGQAKRLEGIKIHLTGELAEHYDIYYRVHVQTYGWQDWVKNGEMAGTSGEAKRLEAIEIKLVEKPKPVPPEVSESQAPSENVSTDPALESSSETESLASQSSNSVEAEIENGSLSQSQSSVESSKFTDD